VTETPLEPMVSSWAGRCSSPLEFTREADERVPGTWVWSASARTAGKHWLATSTSPGFVWVVPGDGAWLIGGSGGRLCGFMLSSFGGGFDRSSVRWQIGWVGYPVVSVENVGDVFHAVDSRIFHAVFPKDLPRVELEDFVSVVDASVFDFPLRHGRQNARSSSGSGSVMVRGDMVSSSSVES
jgi:hypothetical protein